MAIEYIDSRELRLQFFSIIINVLKINEVFGRVYDFCEKYNLAGITNGDLLIVYFMSFPDDDLISDVLKFNGLEYEKDYVIAQEELALGVQNQPSSRLNLPLSSLEGIDWLASVVSKNGNWVWKIDR